MWRWHRTKQAKQARAKRQDALGLLQDAMRRVERDRAAAEDQQVLQQQVPSQQTSPRQTSTTGTAGVGR
jgi:hypothetical protein